MGAAAIPIAAALISTAGTVYASESAKGPAMPKAPVLPKIPQAPVAAAGNQAEQRAKTAGGTILSDQKANQQIADGASTGRKTLLGL